MLELHQSFGTDYQTVAAGNIRMQDLLEKPNGRLHGTVQLTGNNWPLKDSFLVTTNDEIV